MPAYKISLDSDEVGEVLNVSFADTARGDTVVADAQRALDRISFGGGKMLRVNGPASLPVACLIGHRVAHLYGAVSWFDPKMSGYIVAISHDPNYRIGQLI